MSLRSGSSYISCLEQLFVYINVLVSQRYFLVLFILPVVILHSNFEPASDPRTG